MDYKKTPEPFQMVGKFWNTGFERKGYKKKIERFYIAIPREMVHDARFPLKANEDVLIRIEGQKIIVTRFKIQPIE
jgi:hypothetical protein